MLVIMLSSPFSWIFLVHQQDGGSGFVDGLGKEMLKISIEVCGAL